MDDGIPFLPQDIIRNILKRLPVKSLMRFRCVCRQWRFLFTTQSFIADHLDHSNHQNPCLLLPRYDPSKLYCLDSKMQVWELQNLPLPNYLKQGTIIGSSNGLLCFEINKHVASHHFFLVWNPAIREVRQVPETKFHGDCCYHLVGFGFCPITNDYKIVITYYSGFDDDLSAFKVYSLSSGSWKEAKLRLNGTIGPISETVTVNGVMFWWVCNWARKDTDDDYENLILSFDLAVEVFAVIPMPTPELRPIELLVYEEKLAVFFWNKNSKDSAFDMWVMEEGVGASRERWSWTKQYTSGPDPCLTPKTIWKNEILCCDEKDDSTIFLLNPTTKNVKKFAITKCGFGDWMMFNYAESLIPVGGMRSSTNFL